MYPTEVILNETNLDKLTATYKRAYAEILGEIEGATSFGAANRRAILVQIKDVLEDMGVDVQEIIQEELTTQYISGVKDASMQLKQVDSTIEVATGFNRLHKEAILALVDETSTAFAESMQGVNRSAKRLLGQAVKDEITQKLAEGKMTGEALRTIRKNVTAIIKSEGLDALTDKAGRGWTLDRYADMLIRTKAVEARNRGLANRMAENDYDLVQVSSHGGCYLCKPWEGQILSLRGKTGGYRTVDQAQGSGLFHPNCRHAINAFVPSLALKTRYYDPTTQKYLEGTEKQLKTTLAKGRQVTDIFTLQIERIAATQNLALKVGSVKQEARALEKVIRDYGTDVGKLQDVNRAVVFIDDPKKLSTIVKATEAEFGSVTRVKNDLEAKGYKKALINVKTANGTNAEIQVTTQEHWIAKKELGGDELYHKVRAGQGEVEALKRRMDELYAEADRAVAKRLKSSS